MILRITITCISLIVVHAGMGCAAQGGARTSTADGEENLVPLKIECPKEFSHRFLVPFPSDLPDDVRLAFSLDDYEARQAYENMPLMVPHDATTNIALHKPVTSSDIYPIIGDLSQITDGNKEPGEDKFVELAWGPQWVQIDLGDEYEIFAVVIWHYYYDLSRVYRGVVVQIANDPEFTQDVRTVFNNDHRNVNGLGVGEDYEHIVNLKGMRIEVPGVKGRYVRLWSNGNTTDDQNHYVEVEVYGRPTSAR